MSDHSRLSTALARPFALALSLSLVATAAHANPAGDPMRATQRRGDGWVWYARGNPRDVRANPEGGTMLVGGGEDSNEAFAWFLQRAHGGDVLVLRASGADGYNDWMYDLARVDSVETLVVDTERGASDPFVVSRIAGAEAVFLAGGDQWDYLHRWKATPLRAALQQAIDRGAVLGGTSAGMAVLGEHSFSAARDTITSPEALRDPCDPRVLFERDFVRVPHLANVLTDTHFAARDRMGRLLAFTARLATTTGTAPRALAVDEETALLIERDGSARVVGHGAVRALTLSSPPRALRCGAPLTLRNVSVERLDAGRSFDLTRWRGDGVRTRLDVVNGTVRAPRNGSVY